ncbi:MULTISPECIES: Lrp/AsnC family transcriptional regulator [Saliphagus]|uniref:siroheme decarboxylase n=1 Tax=Saliphagus infecundisoli TaxID=1849069 RepID=A0ABD5QJP7_9EURY|nr:MULTISPECIES: Lrp/AsnC family transcriptional regulator [Saliphagus]
MNELSRDWRDEIDDVDAALIDGYQSGFPIQERPFRAVGRDLGIEEDEAVERVRRLREAGVLRRFGPVLNPPAIGSSTLAALRVPEERFERVAEVVNGYRQVNHNYRRDHAWNMWFVVTAGSLAERERIVGGIEDRTGLEALDLPMHTEFYIDLEFPVVNGDRFARESVETTDAAATQVGEEAAGDLSAFEAGLLLAIQEGLELSATPYRTLAAELGVPVGDVTAAIEGLLARGCIKRVGCVVNHVVTGFTANCMVVWDVPDDRLEEWGERAGGLPYVTLCYHRPRRPDQGWPYNLFTMIHGRDREAVGEKIDELAADYLPVAHDRLHSTETLKQTGARYEELVGD